MYISDILSSLGDSGPVYVSVRNRPAAAIIGIKEYLDMTAKAEAFELLQLAEEAENAPKLSYEQIEERIMQNRTARAARSAAEAA